MNEQDIDKISSLIEDLISLFNYDSNILHYDNKKQSKINKILTDIAKLTGTFSSNATNERKNIKKNLTPTSGISLIDITSLEKRIGNLLNTNNIYSCLRTLALSNKCAHSFDSKIGPKGSTTEIFKKYYEKLYGVTLGKNDVTFMKPLEKTFPQINQNNLYDLSQVSDHIFNQMYDLLCTKPEKVILGQKISILNSLKISFDKSNRDEVNRKYQEVINNKNQLLNDFLVKKYQEGVRFLELQNQMFAIKDNYISMIGQLLKKESKFRNIEYELVKTPNPTPGYEYMLIINDKDLSYYIEVHMPNVIAHSLIKEYGLVESTTRKTTKGGAPAVYERDPKEIARIREAKAKGTVTGNIANILSREHTSDSESHPPGENYEFQTQEIASKNSSFEHFLIKNNVYLDEVTKNKQLLLNENYPLSMTESIVCENYCDIYQKLDNSLKIDYVSSNLNEIKNGDQFDKMFFNRTINSVYDMDVIANLLIRENIMKRNFKSLLEEKKESIDKIIVFNEYETKNSQTDSVNHNEKNITENSINYDNKFIKELMIDYIDECINSEINKEIYNEFRKPKK